MVFFEDPIAFVGLLAVVVAVLYSSIKIVKEYERGVIFRLGRLIGAKGPGLFLVIPGIDTMQRVDLRVVTLDVPAQEVITRDNVTVKVNAVIYYRILDPVRAVVEVERYHQATSQIAQTTLRSVVGRSELDEVLSERDRLNSEIQGVIDEATDPWGIKVTAVEIKDVELPKEMQRAIAKQAESERERRARVISAEGELQASKKLAEAARAVSEAPGGMQMRTLQTIEKSTEEKASTTIIPLPMEILEAFKRYADTE
ncbi:MAG: Stomatin [Methanonatronarchaeales archaeon]|nr:Stomatin [Methanonatronarchaeales archaeon]